MSLLDWLMQMVAGAPRCRALSECTRARCTRAPHYDRAHQVAEGGVAVEVWGAGTAARGLLRLRA